jgi:CDP-glycerol glycerophosphotransferase (TagB/SpsB family)
MEKVNNVLTALGLDRTRPIIVFGGTCVPESASYHPYDIFYNTIKKYRNLQVVSKPHPAESERLYKTLLKKHGVSNNILTKKHLLELLAGCTALVTTKSTVALEAMAYGKPVIYINTMNAPLSSFPKRKEGMVEIVKTGQELSEALDRILRTGKTEEAKELAKQYVKQKGKPAAVEVAKIIENML